LSFYEVILWRSQHWFILILFSPFTPLSLSPYFISSINLLFIYSLIIILSLGYKVTPSSIILFRFLFPYLHFFCINDWQLIINFIFIIYSVIIIFYYLQEPFHKELTIINFHFLIHLYSLLYFSWLFILLITSWIINL